MDTTQKLGMSLDDLIKSDKPTKQAVNQSRFRGRNNRRQKKDIKKTVKKTEQKHKSKDGDAEMTDRTSKRRRDRKRGGDKKDVKKTDNNNSKKGKVVIAKKSTKIVLTSKKALEQKRSEKTRVRVTNIPYDVTWREVKDAFAKTAPVERCDVKDGEATISFKTHSDAKRAIEVYNGGNMNGRSIKVFFD